MESTVELSDSELFGQFKIVYYCHSTVDNMKLVIRKCFTIARFFTIWLFTITKYDCTITGCVIMKNCI